MLGDMSCIALFVAGEVGQAALAESSGAAGAGVRAAVDQHAAEITDALGGRLTVGALISYAQGFVEAAGGRGWWPAPRQTLARASSAGIGRSPAWLDWESLRLAAVCRLVLEARGLAL